ncbi:unnamed protein product [Rotaria magnacalcarata]|uniref:Ubiquitin-like protease family profile domain-containing protein n=1 Tax=Rotaria magnacalcarata TaxID=392030 RepID=A0A815R086_9BILA|nr:unnamed protein product [Rotaria magnacalcarata]CAF1559365.1 unnamed protein product [Rotaria magnacalcarata]CAF2018772.1 unnamed protein product [Rotaria magnacalcarata]CAF2044192.1 unnamed protein product [Rotaria magnacalcarata]CAF2103583.1 unnamed protein product [Rotaria magnacalcarata]
MSNNEYSVYNNNTKAYGPLQGYQFNDFMIASATNIILCYKINDDLDLCPTFQSSTLDMHDWKEKNNLYSFILADVFNTYMSHRDKPFTVGPYELNPIDIFYLIEPKYELNDQLMNAHLYKTTTLTTGIVLFDSVSFLKYYSREFRTTAEKIDTQWFNNDIVLVPMPNSRHWILFVIDIEKKTIVFLDSLPSNSRLYEKYKNYIAQLLRTHHFYLKKSSIKFTNWNVVAELHDWQQDDTISCGIYCTFFARFYVTATKYSNINKTNIRLNRVQFALHLLEPTLL